MAAREFSTRRLSLSFLAGLSLLGMIWWCLPAAPAAAQACTFTLNPMSRSFATGGGASGLAVTASGPACTWVVASNAPWITVTAGASGTGNGLVNFSVAVNNGQTRTGTLTVAGQTFTVNQDAGARLGLMFYPLPRPVRLLDTRPGQLGCFAPGMPITVQTERTQSARGVCEGLLIPNEALAVTGNITTVQSGGGYLTLFPSDVQRPLVANSNYTANEIVNNVFTVGLGPDGAFKIFAAFTTDVVIDLTGYYAPPGAANPGGLFFHPLPRPIRLLETRPGLTGCDTPGAPLTGGSSRLQQGRVTCDNITIPVNAQAIAGNATVVYPASQGYLTLYPGNAQQPLVASGNYAVGDILNTPFSVGLAPNGSFNLFTVATTHLVVDVLGYYSADALDLNGVGLLFNPLAHPVRLLDTRPNQQTCLPSGAPLTGGAEGSLLATGTCEGLTIPHTAQAVIGNATVVTPPGAGYLTLWPGAATRPLVASLNYNTNQIVNRHFIVGLGSNERFGVYSWQTTHLVVDLSGYFAPLPANLAPVADAGADQTLALAASANLVGTINDDGLPLGGALTAAWSKLSGPGTVTFGNANLAATSASFSATGTYVLRLTASDGQLSGSDDVMITVNQPLLVNAGADQVITLPTTALLLGTVTGGTGTVTMSWSKLSGPDTVLFSNASASATTVIFRTGGVYLLRLTATESFATGSDDVQVTVNADPTPPPPDPATVAPPLDSSVVTAIGTGTQFLYTGPNPIQTGVASGTITPERAAVLKGRLLDKNNNPLALVKLTVQDHPEFGQTLSRTDGKFDLAVNGGGLLTVNYEKVGFLPVQRQMEVSWQDYCLYPDVVMLGYDQQVTLIDLGANLPMQVARGTISSDSSGSRRATLLFPPGTTAMMKLPGGALQGLTTLHVRATEYTVGPTGPAAMPGGLPPASGYTYAVEYSVDEAVAAGAKSVLFNQPVLHYSENFLNFPVGIVVPVGSYDRDRSAWMPADNGQVIKILSLSGGAAELDTDGDGLADTGASLGITLAERQSLATLYQAGQSLWRTPLTHFSAVDENWPYVPPSDASAPNGPAPNSNPPKNNPCEQKGSILECQNQILGERVGLTGTGYSLNYRSDRTPAQWRVEIALSGANVPASLRRIKLEVLVAGQRLSQEFSNAPNQSYTFTWDNRDAYGRTVQGAQRATVRIGYVYGAVYARGRSIGQAFADYPGARLEGNGTREEITIWQDWLGSIGPLDARGIGLGGWMLSVHHAYDPLAQVLYLGDGSRRSTADLPKTIGTSAGGGPVCSSTQSCGDGGQATSASLADAKGMAVDGQGNLFVADTSHYKVRKVSPSGIITTVAGTGNGGYNGDGIQATGATIYLPYAVAVDAQGNLFIADTLNNRIRKVDSSGVITTVAGNGTSGSSGDGGPATQAQVSGPQDVAVGPDGSLYLAEPGFHRVRRVSPSGIITTVADNPTNQITNPRSVCVDNQGNLFFTSAETRVYRLSPAGQFALVAGGGQSTNDGIPATSASLILLGITVDPTGNLFITDSLTRRIKKVGPDGFITSVAGGGSATGDNVQATSASLIPQDVVVDEQGNLLIADMVGNGSIPHRIRKLRPALPGFFTSISIASEDGGQLYHFDQYGRHLSTINTLTSTTVYTFAYNGAGRLTSVTDGDGNITTIERNASSQATAIVATFGQRTTLSLNSNGYLASLANPATEAWGFGYTSDGLLNSLTDPRGNTSTMNYDARGRLIRDTNPAGGFFALTRTEAADSFTVSLTSALNHTTSYKVERLATGEERRINTFSNNLQTQQLIGTNGQRTTTYPDATVGTIVPGPDPRWSMQAPLSASQTIRTPSGLVFTGTQTRAITLANLADPLSLTSITDTFNHNGFAATSSINLATRTLTSTSAAGRQSSMLLDNQGRVLSQQIPGLAARQFTYDSRGRLTTTTQGSGADTRTLTYGYNAQSYLSSLTDPLMRTMMFERDLVGRVTKQTLPDGREIRFSYDANGNLTSITPPGRPAHSFTLTLLNSLADYIPPLVGAGTNLTRFTYDADRKLDLITRPDGTIIDFGYDAAGRLSTTVIPRGQVSFSYHPTSGNLATITAPDGGTLSYSFDGQLLTDATWSGTVAGTVRRAYDNNFRVTSWMVNGAQAINLQYDQDGLLSQAGNLAISRNAQSGFITGTALGQLTDTWGYNSFGELTSYNAAYSGAGLYSVQHSRDKLGRITQKTETVGGITDAYNYAYDQAGRLIGVQKNNIAIATYSYDSNSNRLSYASPGGTVNGAYDAQDRLTQSGATTYTYTANGELLGKTAGGQTTTYQYDGLNNLLRVNLPGNTQIDYLIDGQNRRIGKKVNGTLVQGFLYQYQLNPIAELDGNNNVVSRFVYGARSNVPEYMIKGGVTYRIISDHLGSPRLVVNVTTGAIAQRMDYDEFGVLLMDTNPGFQPFGFAGGIYDLHTKLTRFGMRDYEAQTGRWTAKDPILFAGRDTNLYGYVLTDPVNLVDPTGMQGTPLMDALNARYSLQSNSIYEDPEIKQIGEQMYRDRGYSDPRELLDDWLWNRGAFAGSGNQEPVDPYEGGGDAVGESLANVPPNMPGGSGMAGGGGSAGGGAGASCKPKPPKPPCVDCQDMIKKHGRIIAPCQVWPPCSQ